MMRSLFSAVTGLKNHQTRMDVIGNNVANVNTTGYKRNMVNFTTILSQTLRGAAEPTAASGGTNPMQVGLGMSIGSIEKIMTEGSSQMTGVATHAKISGPGWFMLSKDGADTSNVVYSRAGVFIVDSMGRLVDSATGYFVLQSDGTSIIEIDPEDYSLPTVKLAANGDVMAIDLTTGEEISDWNIGLAIFPNEAGLTAIGNTYYKQSLNSGVPTIYGQDATDPYPEGTELVPGFIEMSNVNLADEFTDMIITQRGFQANSRVITVSDTLLEELINLKR